MILHTALRLHDFLNNTRVLATFLQTPPHITPASARFLPLGSADVALGRCHPEGCVGTCHPEGRVGTCHPEGCVVTCHPEGCVVIGDRWRGPPAGRFCSDMLWPYTVSITYL